MATLALAVALDLALGEPPTAVHPVVGIGRLIGVLVKRAPGLPMDREAASSFRPCFRPCFGMASGPSRQLAYGAVLTATTIGATALAALAAEALLGRLPRAVRVPLRALFLKPSFAVAALFAAAREVEWRLAAGDLDGGRAALRSLVSRDSSALDASLVAAATVESVAENAGDSIVAPLVAWWWLGLPGAYAYRAANTLDAMIGYRGEYEYLGKVAARLDDLLNLLPARLTALAIAAGALVTGSDAQGSLRIAWRDHARTASPNAGWPMSAMAGALGVELEKVGHYRLGDPTRPAEAADIRRARRIVGVGFGAAVAAVVGVRWLFRRPHLLVGRLRHLLAPCSRYQKVFDGFGDTAHPARKGRGPAWTYPEPV
ncbi:MAG: cobalamin biosynthesis protein CobD, partial [Chloroflexi bacterium]|nr:cobalamin biosynthesis protein CobD [Chloroflexota bacterium]